jgi:hypothetical protein
MIQALQKSPTAIRSWRATVLTAACLAALAWTPAHANPIELTDMALEEVTAGSSAGAGLANALAIAAGRFNSARTNTDVVVSANGKRTSVTASQTADALGTDGALAAGGVMVTAGSVTGASSGAGSSQSGTANVTSKGRAISSRGADLSVVRTTATASGPGAQATTSGGSTVSGSGMSVTTTTSRQIGDRVMSRTLSIAFGT